MQNFVFFDGQFPRVRGVIIVEDFGDGCMLVLPSGKISDDERNATEDRLRTCSTYAAGTRPTGASSSCFGFTLHQLRRVIESQVRRWRTEAERVDTQLVVHAFDKEENLVLLDSELVVCVWLGFVVVCRLEDGEVGFWIVGHVEGRYQVKVAVAI